MKIRREVCFGAEVPRGGFWLSQKKQGGSDIRFLLLILRKSA
jgi:hypothetical protein